MGIQSYRDLYVWQKAMDLVVETYSLVKLLPREENYALSAQMRRAVVSIPSNIAEGHQRSSKKDYIRFLYIAGGSNAELETQLLICQKLNYLSQEQTETALKLCEEISRMLSSLIKKLEPPNP